MLNTMKSWLGDKEVRCKSPKLKLSITKLMIGMMMVDEQIDEFEHAAIMSFLTDNFDLTSEKSSTLIKQLQNDANDEVAFDRDAKQLSDGYTAEECAYILSIVWRIALVDGKITTVEEKYLHRLANVFGVSDTTLDALKKEQERNFPHLIERDHYEEF